MGAPVAKVYPHGRPLNIGFKGPFVEQALQESYTDVVIAALA